MKQELEHHFMNQLHLLAQLLNEFQFPLQSTLPEPQTKPILSSLLTDPTSRTASLARPNKDRFKKQVSKLSKPAYPLTTLTSISYLPEPSISYLPE